MQVEIIKPDSTLFKGEAEIVTVPGAKGSFTILNNHAPIISTLEKGSIRVVHKGKEEFFEVEGGIIQNKDDRIVIVAE